MKKPAGQGKAWPPEEKMSRWRDFWEDECSEEFVDRFYKAEEKYGFPRKLRGKTDARIARETLGSLRDIYLKIASVPQADALSILFDRFSDRREIERVAAELGLYGAVGRTGVLRAAADYLDSLKYDRLLELTERLWDYATIEIRGRAVHTAREIKERFAPSLQMRTSEWRDFLKARAIPFKQGPIGRPRKNASTKK